MGADPVRQGLRPRRLRIGEAGGPEPGGSRRCAGRQWRSSCPNSRRRPCRRRRDAAASSAKAAVRNRERDRRAAAAIAAGMHGAIFFPQNEERNARLLELDDKVGPVRFKATPHALLDPGPCEQLALEGIVGQFARQRPGQPRRGPSLQVVLNGATRHPERRAMSRALVPSLPSRSICLHCLMVSFLFAGITLSLFDTRSVMPQLLTQVVLFSRSKVAGY